MVAAGHGVGAGAEVSHVPGGVDCDWDGAWHFRNDCCVFAMGFDGCLCSFFAGLCCRALCCSLKKAKECVQLKPAGLTIVPEEIK
jgi:hypothetical protein